MKLNLYIIACFLLMMSGCAPNPGKGTPDYTIQYGFIAGVDNNLLSLDIYNEGIVGPAPVVIWIHGGGWQTGDKANSMELKESLCKNQGYLLVSINYRLSTVGSGIQHPTHAQDVAKAISWVYYNIGQYGGDSTKIAVLGHSAGAHLAALVCTDETYLQAEGLDLNIISGCGSFDTEAYNIPYSMANGNEDNQLYLNAFTTSGGIWADASPTYHVDPGKGIPMFLLARRGAATRKLICNEFSDSLNSAGISTTIIEASGLSHQDVNDKIGAENDQVMTPFVLQFLQTVFN
jgi:acetyl esterase/lipase